MNALKLLSILRRIPKTQLVTEDTTNCAYEDWKELSEDAEYDGRSVSLNKPFRSNDGKHKFYVYVKNDKGNVIKLGFGDPNLSIKRDDPDRRKNYRARHGCDNPGPKWKAEYWSCKMWSAKPVSDIAEAFFASYEGHGYMGITEVWINPTTDEIREASRNKRWNMASFDNAPAPTAFSCRAWLTDKHLFVWDKDSDEHMDVEKFVMKAAREKNVPVNFTNAIALDLYYFPEVRELGLRISPWSNPHKLLDTHAVKLAEKNPAVKALRLKPIPMT